MGDSVEAKHRDWLPVVVTCRARGGPRWLTPLAVISGGCPSSRRRYERTSSLPGASRGVGWDEPLGHGRVGWSILLSLARAKVQRDGPGVLDAVARAPEIELIREVAAEERARPVVIVTQCVDVYVHRSQIERRDRGIPKMLR
jgi:hypothetical protein